MPQGPKGLAQRYQGWSPGAANVDLALTLGAVVNAALGRGGRGASMMPKVYGPNWRGAASGVYRGYEVTPNPFDGLFRIAKDGYHIATAQTPEEAMQIIESLTP